ncbi:UDP-N-acetylmuramoyl-L-alanine--D-glutamate ligase [Deinococcus sp. KNUC1210]|uniref:UDP-N-acetylmuramoyl-L-alanine--D-glutamate ligase n=1 Tax=Deinococcus sp. KNUC1210 TaxID=2917691 RepID=UPI001EEFB151|nr:UDP-N-acetylmuramoyl-L-alanine--D-glutamate ligase [Deinococcus sp. KNUC1210]ULH15184.1 UDP-N-acetylmuramoyl-L-alanine--D-glutamate ligase [Deinococcus sp. KNUC1210]
MSTLIYGLGRSGRGVARFLAARGEVAEWYDARPQPQDLELMVQLGFGQGDPARPYTRVVAAPGVPIDHPDLLRLGAGGAEILGEVELAYRAFPDVPMVGVTGTAGKGSTTVLIAELLRAHGLRAREGGNIDPPLLDVIAQAEVAVVELSSFQLERVPSFRPAVAVISNLGVDHLDRHGSVQAYHAAKRNITAHQTPGDALILAPGLDVPTRAQVTHFDPARLLLASGREVLPVSELPEGIHPGNAAAALLAAEALLTRLGRAADPDLLAAALRQARAVHGRFETVARLQTAAGTLRFINDSIATRTLAVQAALEQAASPVAWLVGGRDKGADLEPLREAAQGKVVRVIGFGEDGENFARALGLPYFLVGGESGEEMMDNAVQAAVGALSLDGPPQGTVLLSPIGTSFDAFRDYQERGDTFTRAVQRVLTQLQSQEVTL